MDIVVQIYSTFYLSIQTKTINFAKNIYARQFMTAREDKEKEKEKTSRETLGKFFYDLTKTCFTAIVVGNVISMFSNDGNEFYSVMLF